RTTATRQISNDLVGTTNPLGSYNTMADGTVEWTPFADTQKGTGQTSDPDPKRYGYNISWASPYKDKNGTPATSGTDVANTYSHFGTDGKTVITETESATYKVNNNQWAEYARSYSNAASGQTGVGDGSGSEGKIQMNDGDGQPQYYGNYYNMYAASAGSVTYKMTSGDGMNSVCPRNWILPRNSGDKSWYNLLYTKYGMTVTGNGSTEPEKAAAIAIENTALKKKPFSIIQAGFYYWARGGLDNRGSNAYYWSSHPSSQAGANFLYFYTTQSFYPQAGYDKIFGFTVRCVAR
ncbi:MAG: FISUMP domain-containing protein, partial [Candidatus Saccharibacteria bacterium]|nr:FISUMP domain-containing protein [Candidatus Saccharibacteria bacterium]